MKRFFRKIRVTKYALAILCALLSRNLLEYWTKGGANTVAGAGLVDLAFGLAEDFEEYREEIA